MIAKKSAWLILAFLFFLSVGASYVLFTWVAPAQGLVVFSSFRTPSGPTPTVITSADAENLNEPKTEECPLNGEMVGKSLKTNWEKVRPLGIMVENHTEARPQSGLSSADVVYEAVAEGGITRFLVVFYCHNAAFVGPVRSARIYFVKTIQGYGENPLYAHVGGANTDGPADALGEIEDLGWANYNDLNQFSVPFPNFWRDYDRLPDRATEHTVYTDTSKLWNYAKAKRELSNVDDKGVAWNKNFEPWLFKDDAKTGDRGTVNKIDFGFWNTSAADYGVTWTYDKATNSYKRSNGGKPHVDNNTKKQLEAKNVVVVFAEESPANDGYEGGHLLYDVVGTGTGYVFQDGKVIKITWKKPDEESMFRFYDEKGKEVNLVRGKIFVEILPTGNKVTY